MVVSRRVRKLRLQIPNESLLAPGQFLVEDALRTASLPDAGGARVYFVRRLSLGVIDLARPPGVLAQRLERIFAELHPLSVHAGAAQARMSNIVFFHDSTEPYIQLAQLLVKGTPPDDWFWPLAVQGYSPCVSRSDALRAAISGLLATPAGMVAVAGLVEALGTAHIDELCQLMRASEAESWLQSSSVLAPILSNITAPPRMRLPPPWQEVLERWVPRWGSGDPRTRWLAAVLVCVQTPAWASPARLAQRASSAIAAAALAAPDSCEDEAIWTAPDKATAISEQRPRRSSLAKGGELELARSEPVVTEVTVVPEVIVDQVSRKDSAAIEIKSEPHQTPPRASLVQAAAEEQMPISGPVEGTSVALVSPDTSESAVPGVTVRRSPIEVGSLELPAAVARLVGSVTEPAEDLPALTELRPAMRRSAPRFTSWNGVSRATAAGGLLFLIRPLTSLGFPQWLETEPVGTGGGSAARLLHHVAGRVGVEPDDPILAPWDIDEAFVPSTAELAAQRRWCLQLAQWTRRRVRLSIRKLVCRPARIVATRTHVDIVLDLRDADIRVRAAGLDIDPGWVPWLAHVVQFHYIEAT